VPSVAIFTVFAFAFAPVAKLMASPSTVRFPSTSVSCPVRLIFTPVAVTPPRASTAAADLSTPPSAFREPVKSDVPVTVSLSVPTAPPIPTSPLVTVKLLVGISTAPVLAIVMRFVPFVTISSAVPSLVPKTAGGPNPALPPWVKAFVGDEIVVQLVPPEPSVVKTWFGVPSSTGNVKVQGAPMPPGAFTEMVFAPLLVKTSG